MCRGGWYGRLWPEPSGPAAPFPHVEQDGAEDDGAEDDFLSVAFHPGEVHAVLDDGDDEGADEGAEDFSFAAAQAGASDHDGRDHIEFVARSVGRRTAFELGGEQHTAE